LLEAKLEAELDDWPIDVYLKPNRSPANAKKSEHSVNGGDKACPVSNLHGQKRRSALRKYQCFKGGLSRGK
jgi:hypothetical protein